MSAPFGTLQLALDFEAAGFLLDHANKMATAVAQATIGADLATKADLAPLTTKADVAALAKDLADAKFDLVKMGRRHCCRGGRSGVHRARDSETVTTIILDRLPPTAASAVAPRANVLVADILRQDAGEVFDRDR